MSPLSKSPFSRHFNALKYFGAWLYDTKDPVKINIFALYRLLITVFEVYGLYGLFLDLYMVLGDMKKMSWNLCVSTLLLGTIVKNHQMLEKSQTINHLRWMLHRDAESRHDPEDIFIHNLAVKELKLLRISFYGTAVVFIPTWLFLRYSGFFWGIRELPIPFRLPEIVNLENDIQFHFAYITLGACGTLGTFLAIETELAMYGILIQISREYTILNKDIRLMNQIYDSDDEDSDGNPIRFKKKEVNPWLRKLKTETLLKKFFERQKTLIEYTEAFEICFNKPLLQEFLGISIMILTLALQCLWESVDFSGNLLYQMGYLFIIVVNIFLMCLFSTRLRTQCLEVGEAAYSTFWYKMEVDIQKDIAMMIMRSQHPPKITTGKFIVLSLNVFMNMMSHLYSWLALFRQIDSSVSTQNV